MSIRPSAPGTRPSISKSALRESLEAEQAKQPLAAPSAKAQQFADTQATAKAKAPATPPPNAAAVGAYQTSSIARVVRSNAQANPLAGLKAALQGAKADNPQRVPDGGPAPDLPGVVRDVPIVGRKDPRAPGEPVVAKETGTVQTSSGLLPELSSPTATVREQLGGIQDANVRKGFDQGFADEPAVDGSGGKGIGGNPVKDLTSGGIGGLLGEAASSDVKGARDTSSSNLAGGFVEDFINGVKGIFRQGEKGTVNEEAAKQLDELEKEEKGGGNPAPSPPPAQGGGTGSTAGGGVSTPAPDGEGRRPGGIDVVGSSPALQRQFAARLAGKLGSEIQPSPEDNPAVRDSSVTVPGGAALQHSLVGMPVDGQIVGGGTPRSGPDYGGDAGAIDLGPDAVHGTQGGIVQDPGDAVDPGAPTRDFPVRSGSGESGGSNESGSSSGESGSDGGSSAGASQTKAS